MERGEEGSRLDSFQKRLNYLFDTVRPVGKVRYSVRDVAEAIKSGQGEEISAAYIHHLLTGERDNPGVRQVRALAKFFGVPPAWLVGDGDLDAVTAELKLLRIAIETREQLQRADDAMSDPQVRRIAVMARGLSPSHLRLVGTVLRQVRELEGLGNDNEDQPERSG